MTIRKRAGKTFTNAMDSANRVCPRAATDLYGRRHNYVGHVTLLR